MMKKPFVFVVLFMMSTFALSDAQEKKTDQNALIEEALELSGARAQILQIPALVHAEAAQRRGLKPEDEAKIGQIITESYRADELYQAVKDHFKSHFDQRRFLVLLQWLRSPLARKISALEVQASTPEAMQDIQLFAAQLQRKPPHQERLALVRKLDEATSTTDFNIEIRISSFRELAKAINPLLPPEKQLQEGQLEQLINNMRAQLYIPVKNEVLVSMLYTYQSVADHELREYLTFLESDTGRWFTKLANNGLMSAMTVAAEKFGNGVKKTLLSKKSLKST